MLRTDKYSDRFFRLLFCCGVLWLTIVLPFYSQPVIAVGSFSTQNAGDPLPPGWIPLTFKKIQNLTNYTLVKDDGVTVIRASSNLSSSAIMRKITMDPKLFPIITWQWKVSNIIEKGDLNRKDGDDYPARVYITFTHNPDNLNFLEKVKYEAARLIYGEYPPAAAINYIWANHAPAGTITRNPYTERVKMIVLQSGSRMINTWITEQRDILDDYRQAFGEEPPFISAVALMTDSDNTQSSATAYFGDIFFSRNK